MYKYYVEMVNANGKVFENKEFNTPGLLRVFDSQNRLILEWRSPPIEAQAP